MELFRFLDRRGIIAGGCVVTIGNFDGVHRGHQVVLERTRYHARELGVASVVLSFEPQPLEYFQAQAAPARLTSFREKYTLLAAWGIDHFACLRFDASLARVAAGEFVQGLFVEALGAKCIVVGDDFRFGKNREGDIDTLRELGPPGGFEVTPVAAVFIDNERVSSSAVREALAAHDFARAARLLGRSYSISGRVRHGDKRGRQLGFPTANIALKRTKSPLHGVYAVRVIGRDGRRRMGVANIGTRPVFDGKQLLLEVHVLDYNKDIYGQHLQVEFVRHLRDERKFNSIDELKSHIDQDIEQARTLFSELENTQNR